MSIIKLRRTSDLPGIGAFLYQFIRNSEVEKLTQVATFLIAVAMILPIKSENLKTEKTPCKQITCRDCTVKVCKYKKIALSDDLKLLHIQSIDKHDKLCYNKKSENNKHHTGRRRIGVRLHPIISSVCNHLTDLVQWLLSCLHYSTIVDILSSLSVFVDSGTEGLELFSQGYFEYGFQSLSIYPAA